MAPRNQKPAKAKMPPALREPTPAEAAAIAAAQENLANRPPRASVTLGMDGTVAQLANPHSDGAGWTAHLTDAFGTSSEDFAHASMARLANAVASKGQAVTQEQLNAALALMGAIGPGDELEAALGELIVANHAATMDFLRRARDKAGEYPQTAAAYSNMANKHSRTVGALVESLAKLRTGGRQRIEVIYVNGPAVIGDHAQTVIAGEGRGGAAGNLPQSYGPAMLAGLAAAGGLPMRSEDQARDALPITSRSGPETLQDPRGLCGRAERAEERQLQARSADQGNAGGAGAHPIADQGGEGA